MKNGTQDHIRDSLSTRRQKTNHPAQTGKQIHRLYEKNTGRSRNKERQKAVCTLGHAANGFLNCAFLPKWQQPQQMPDSSMEGDFYQSLSRLSVHYKITPLETAHLSFPYNIALSCWDAERQIKQKVSNNLSSLSLIEDDNTIVSITTHEEYSTGAQLYYIPVAPLYRMFSDKNSKRAAALLLSVCAYLYHIVDVPYYRQEDSYLYWQFNMLSEWIDQDDNGEDNIACKRELQKAEWIGDYIEQKIFNRKNLDVFTDRVKAFNPKNDYQRECLKLAEDALLLFQQYPEQSVFRSAQNTFEDPDTDNEVITMDKYISFIADTEGWLYDNLAEIVNNEFNEYGDVQEPAITKQFNGKDVSQNNLDFENRLFPIIEELCYLLNTYKK